MNKVKPFFTSHLSLFTQTVIHLLPIPPAAKLQEPMRSRESWSLFALARCVWVWVTVGKLCNV